MSKKCRCAVCGSGRQRNLVFMPQFSSLYRGGIEFPTRMTFDSDIMDTGDSYICYRCLELPTIRELRAFDNRYARMSGEPEKPLYRYSDEDEAVLANKLKNKLS